MSEDKIIVQGLRRFGKRAYDEARKKGIPVTVLRGNSVCRIDPDGSIEVLNKVQQSKFRVTQRKFKL